MCVLECGGPASCPTGFACRGGLCEEALAGAPDEREDVTGFVAPPLVSAPFVPDVPADACPASPGLDGSFALVERDLMGFDAEDRPYLRYVSLVHRAGAGDCQSALSVHRTAVSKLVNFTSRRERLSLPRPIDENHLLLRLDLRSSGWDQPVSAGGETHRDGWEAVLAAAASAVEFSGPVSDRLVRETGTRVPLLPSHALVHAASRGPTYAGLLALPDTLDELTRSLGLDLEASRASGQARRGVTDRSVASRQDRLFEWLPLPNGRGSLWLAFDYAIDSELPSPFVSPLTAEGDGVVAFHSLENGLLAFLIFDAAGRRRDDSELLFDTLQNDFRARAAVSCMGCHVQGPLPFEERVRDFVLGAPEGRAPELVEAVDRVYARPGELEAVMSSEAAAYQARLASLGQESALGDSVADVSLAFERDLEPREVAAELFVDPEWFEEHLDDFPVELRRPTVPRTELTQSYAGALCVAAREARERPAGCD